MSNNFLKSFPFWDSVEKYCSPEQATDDNLVPAHCMLDTSGYKHTLKLYNTYRFSFCKNGYANAPQCYVILTLPVLPMFCTARNTLKLIAFNVGSFSLFL